MCAAAKPFALVFMLCYKEWPSNCSFRVQYTAMYTVTEDQVLTEEQIVTLLVPVL